MKNMFRKFTSSKRTNNIMPHTVKFVRKQVGAVEGESDAFTKITNLLNFTKFSGSSYAATDYPAGYHTIKIDNQIIKGQRQPKQRLDQLDFDFRGKCILDIGSNQGGMLFAISNEIRWGIGLDYDTRMVNVSNAISRHLEINNCSFFVHDIDNDPMELIEDYLPEKRVDIVFLLSVCMWVKNWRQLIIYAANISNNLLFETNGTNQQQQEQEAFVKITYKHVDLLSGYSSDDEGKKQRRLYFCRNSES